MGLKTDIVERVGPVGEPPVDGVEVRLLAPQGEIAGVLAEDEELVEGEMEPDAALAGAALEVRVGVPVVATKAEEP